jgi:hypothetical protein
VAELGQYPVPGPEDYPEHLCDEEGEALDELAFTARGGAGNPRLRGEQKPTCSPLVTYSHPLYHMESSCAVLVGGAAQGACRAACEAGMSAGAMRRSPVAPLGIVFPLVPEKQFTSTLI